MTARLAAVLGAAMLLGLAAPSAGQDAPAQERQARFGQLPFWPGYWVSEGQAGTTIGGIAPASLEARESGAPLPAGFMSLTGGGAPWNDEGKARMAARAQAAPGRKAMGWGYPMMMNSAAPLQFLITPEETLIVSPYGDVRHIYTDGRPLPPAEDLWPTVWGTSVGRWDGDALVVETVAVRNPSVYFHSGPPLSDDARYFERIRMEGDRIVSDIRIEDPVTLTQPWTATMSYVRDEGFDRMIHIDYDNDRTGFEDGVNTIEPEAQGR